MKLTGGEIIVKELARRGTPYIIGIPGHGVLGLFDAIRKEEAAGNIKYLQVKHEQAATAIADGYYRVSGRPLAVFSSIGPGTLNTAIGLATAYVDSTAFIEFCGDVHTNMKGVGVLQEIDRYRDGNIIESLSPLAKRSWRAESVRQLPRIMKRAFGLSLGGRPGPAVIALPMDVQSAAIEVAEAEEKDDKVALPSADSESIERAIKLMKTAKRPVILAGGGALRAKCAPDIEALAEKWGAAIATTLAGKGAVRENHPQYAFHTGSKGTPIGIKICREADVILAIGARFADETACSYRKGASFDFPDTKLIHIDIDAGEINKNYRADVGIVADLKDALKKLNESFGGFEINGAYLSEIARLRGEWKNYLIKIRSAGAEKPTISQLVGILNETLPQNTIISTSSGNTQAQLFQEYEYPEPYCNLTTGGFSTMGWAVPAAIGAKLALPERPVVALLGDGDFMMIMQELSTIAQYDIPVVIIMADNMGWMAIKDLQADALGKDFTFGNDFMKGDKVYAPDFKKIAEGFGIKAYKPESLGEIRKAVSDAVALNRPAFVSVDVSREYPHTGGKAFGWWDVPVPEYIEDKRKGFEKASAGETV
jgi:Thiamine pyrophosphate-requiring enzymes [acetolactate synthase, pyruvate dehydrogenase (cytochrome), glyoxylate carboligase, phosphonopyruvate decarboxylase]